MSHTLDRRKFLSIAASSVGALGINAEASATPSAAALPNEGQPRYNVLLLMSDQHKRSCMGVSGDATAITPNLDALARESVRFTSAYCSNPVCGPSRASLLTGLYSHHLEAQNNSSSFSHKHKTIADQFSAAGYLTALVGKMHFADAQTHGFQYKLEFNDWLQYLGPKAKL
jgi:choline-sulfatase